MISSWLVLLVAALNVCCVMAQPAPAELIVLHGNIVTGAHLVGSDFHDRDNSRTAARVAALAISGAHILAAGSDAEILALQGPHTQVIDLHGAFVVPGFNDAHTHLAGAGLQKISVDLDGADSLIEMLRRIRSFAASAAPGQWIQGAGWDHTVWPSKTLPTRADLDSVTSGHPAVFYRTDGHIVVANSAALRAAGISSSSPDPAGGKIDRDASGEPTGIVREGPAVSLLTDKIPAPTAQTRRKALALAIADALAHGVTSVQDFSDWQDWLVLESMEKEGALNLRVSEWMAFDTPLEILKTRKASHPANDPLLHLGQLKGFMDGSLGSRTAALAQPYSDDPGNSGLARYEQKRLNQLTAERVDAGFEIGFHAIGDRANSMALTALDNAIQGRMKTRSSVVPHVERNVGGNLKLSLTTRYRIEHAQVLLPQDFDRYARLHIIASMQPSHLLTDMNWAGDRLGPERSKFAYAWRSMLDHHISLAFGTDYPVESISPFRGLYAAVTRQNEAGTNVFHPEQRINIAEALYAYTQGSAFAEGREASKGRLEPGYLADFVVLDQDVLSATPRQILNAHVLRTVMGGQTVFTAPILPAAAGGRALFAPAHE